MAVVCCLHHFRVHHGEERVGAALTNDTVGITKNLEGYRLKGGLTGSLARFE